MYISLEATNQGYVIIGGVSPELLEGGIPKWYYDYKDEVELEKILKIGKLTLTFKGYVPATVDLIKKLELKYLKEFLVKHPEHLDSFTMQDLLDKKGG